jgi:hypothetical protein
MVPSSNVVLCNALRKSKLAHQIKSKKERKPQNVTQAKDVSVFVLANSIISKSLLAAF